MIGSQSLVRFPNSGGTAPSTNACDWMLMLTEKTIPCAGQEKHPARHTEDKHREKRVADPFDQLHMFPAKQRIQRRQRHCQTKTFAASSRWRLQVGRWWSRKLRRGHLILSRASRCGVAKACLFSFHRNSPKAHVEMVGSLAAADGQGYQNHEVQPPDATQELRH